MPFRYTHRPYYRQDFSQARSGESPLIKSVEPSDVSSRGVHQEQYHQRSHRCIEARTPPTQIESKSVESFSTIPATVESTPLASLGSRGLESAKNPHNDTMTSSSRRRNSHASDGTYPDVYLRRSSRSEFAGPLAQPYPLVQECSSRNRPATPRNAELALLSTSPLEFRGAPSVRTTSEDQASGSDQSSVRTVRSDCCAVHTALEGHCEFILLPPSSSLPSVTGGKPTDFAAFFGQLRFSTTPSQLAWLIAYLTDSACTPLKVRRAGQGCFTASFARPEELVRVLQLQDRLLSDVAGVWYARTEEAKRKLSEYSEDLMTYFAVHAGLPKSFVVVREKRGAVARVTT